MNQFIKSIAKFAVYVGIGMVLTLLIFAAILLIAPEFVWEGFRYGAIAFCLATAVGLVSFLTSAGKKHTKRYPETIRDKEM